MYLPLTLTPSPASPEALSLSLSQSLHPRPPPCLIIIIIIIIIIILCVCQISLSVPADGNGNMPRNWLCRAWKCHLWDIPVTPFLLLYIGTFGIFLPLICWDLPYSHFYQRKSLSLQRTTDYLTNSLEEARKAVRYFETIEAENRSSGPEPEPGACELVITVVTTPRSRGRDHRYLLRTVSSFHRLLSSCPDCASYRLLLCNVHQPPGEHTDAVRASRLASRTVQRHVREPGPPAGSLPLPPSPTEVDNLFEKEKKDYIFCLNQSLSLFLPRHVLLVEDDAVPRPDIFPVLRDLLRRRSAKRQVRESLYLKLYHPERLQGYLNPEPMRLAEWVGLGLVGGSALALAARRVVGKPTRSKTSFLLLVVYCMGLAEMLGRTYLLELRRCSPQLYALAPVTECCTPAMVYPAPAARLVVRYLQHVHCRPGLAKDTVLYQALSLYGQHGYSVEPNLVSHVGFYSTLRAWAEAS
uniref:Post-GPI attachment to proteins GalNAc transferase 4 n=1 Tax=Callorhinchus milii TaxID=7868 RepID=A0A4W3GUW0_CALMI|eukprot:gi/632989452/ref/XP_007883656.1/ PREDICTED: transmembrane protein 246 [Callorhinchus milii]